MASKYLSEKQYFNFVAAIASLHDCHLMDINFSERVINIMGPPKEVHSCLEDLSILLGRHGAEQ